MIGLQISITGLVLLVVAGMAVQWIGKCPKRWIALPILTAYFSGIAMVIGGTLWFTWA